MMKNFTIALFLGCTFIFPFSAPAQTTTKKDSAAMKAVQTITCKQLGAYLSFIASDEMEGRDTPSRGLDLTAKFLAMQLSRWGLRPAGDDGTFFQKIALKKETLDPDKIELAVDGKKFVYDEDFYYLSGDGVVNAPLVFANHGWMVKSKRINAYDGIDVQGKIVVLYSDGLPTITITKLPKGVTQRDLAGEIGVDWADPATYLRQKGALGILLIASPTAQKSWKRIRNLLANRPVFVPEKLGSTTTSNTLPYMFVSEKVAETIFAGATSHQSATSAYAINKNGKLAVVKEVSQGTTQNVAAIWEGGDPALRDEIVAVGAHYDHLGINATTASEDKIWNGADDNGSGTSAILAIAEALSRSAHRPRRSILLIWHAGEEKGLWGSRYFTEHPSIPLEKVVAHLNVDMIGRSKKPGDTNPKNAELSAENEIYVIGSKMMSPDLGNLTESVNNSFLKLRYNYRYDDPKDKNQFFFRSDHLSYAKKGIPIVFWFGGVHADYHQPGDEPQKIDCSKMENVTRTIFMTMWELADAKTRPVVDKKIPDRKIP